MTENNGEEQEKEIVGLRIVTKDQFTLEWLAQRYGTKESIEEVFEKLADGYNFILKGRESYYSVNFINELLER